jgi:Family of unknown function (DUF6220)
MQAVRRGAAAIYKVLIAIFAAAVVVQFFLAGLGIFGAIPEEDGSTTAERWEDKIDPHAALGHFLQMGSLLLLLLILIAWTGPRSIGATFALAVLLILQIVLAAVGEDTPAIGALHPVNALLILALSFFLAWRAWRGNLLVPPSRASTAPPPPAP